MARFSLMSRSEEDGIQEEQVGSVLECPVIDVFSEGHNISVSGPLVHYAGLPGDLPQGFFPRESADHDFFRISIIKSHIAPGPGLKGGENPVAVHQDLAVPRHSRIPASGYCPRLC